MARGLQIAGGVARGLTLGREDELQRDLRLRRMALEEQSGQRAEERFQHEKQALWPWEEEQRGFQRRGQQFVEETERPARKQALAFEEKARKRTEEKVWPWEEEQKAFARETQDFQKQNWDEIKKSWGWNQKERDWKTQLWSWTRSDRQKAELERKRTEILRDLDLDQRVLSNYLRTMNPKAKQYIETKLGAKIDILPDGGVHIRGGEYGEEGQYLPKMAVKWLVTGKVQKPTQQNVLKELREQYKDVLQSMGYDPKNPEMGTAHDYLLSIIRDPGADPSTQEIAQEALELEEIVVSGGLQGLTGADRPGAKGEAATKPRNYLGEERAIRALVAKFKTTEMGRRMSEEQLRENATMLIRVDPEEARAILAGERDQPMEPLLGPRLETPAPPQGALPTERIAPRAAGLNPPGVPAERRFPYGPFMTQ